MRRTGLAFTSTGSGAEAERFRLLPFKGTKGERRERQMCAHTPENAVCIMVVVGI